MSAGPAPTSAGDARARIIDAGVRCLVRAGTVDATMAAIAKEGGVSKALLHYHFADRAHLLAAMIRSISRRLTAREMNMMQSEDAARSVDALWQWVEEELKRGELRALLQLGAVDDLPVQRAYDEAHRNRHVMAETTISRLFQRLGLTPRVPVPIIADAAIAFTNGLALLKESNARARVSFDVFWLAMLGLCD